MKFGHVPLAQAEGAILAHSVRLVDGRLRKGQILDAGDIRALAAAGLSKVVVAEPDAHDLMENDAAQLVADSLLDGVDGLHLTTPFTGRVNLIADAPGVVVVDADKVVAANLIDPMVTTSTVTRRHTHTTNNDDGT